MPQDNKARPPHACGLVSAATRPAAGDGTRKRAAPALPVAVALCAALLLCFAAPVLAMELCGDKSRELMRSAGITTEQIQRLCELEAEASRLTRLSIRRAEDEGGYCRVTLALKNDSVRHINTFTLTSANGRYDIFQFFDILPGATAYASAASRALMSCAELPELKVVLRWPGSVRADDRAVQGRLLEQFKPALASKELKWTE